MTLYDAKQARDNTVTPRKLAAPMAVAYAPSVTLDTSIATDFVIGVLTGNLLATLSAAAGRSGTIAVRQDGTGNRAVQFAALGYTIYSDASIDPASAAGAITVFEYLMQVIAGVSMLWMRRTQPTIWAPATGLLFDGDHVPFVYDGDHASILTGA
jgi:hypothetical protein